MANSRLRAAIETTQGEFNKAFGQDVAYKVGRKEWNEHNRPPLIGWIKPGGRLVAVRSPAPPHDVGDTCEERALVPDMAVDRQRIDIHLWGRDEEECELLFDAMLVALEKSAPAVAFDWLDVADYETPSQSEGKQLDHGQLVILPVFLLRTVAAETRHTAQFQRIEHHEWDISASTEAQAQHGENDLDE